MDESAGQIAAADLDDGAIVELVGHASENTFTNYLYHVSQVPIDFPVVAFVEEEEASPATA